MYSVLKEVTRGITSLRSTKLTTWMMSWVLFELIQSHPGVLESREKSYKVKKGNNIIVLISQDQKKAIEILRKIADMNDYEYLLFCKRLINRECPLSSEEAKVIMDALQKQIQKSRRK